MDEYGGRSLPDGRWVLAGGPDEPPERPSGLAADLARWAADASVQEAAAMRARERWLNQQAAEEATFAGVLLDLAERGTAVMVQMAGGRWHHGAVKAVAAGFVVVATSSGREVMVVLSQVSSVRPEPGTTAPRGDRIVVVDTTLGDALAAMAADRSRVLIVTVAGDGISGELRSVGRDVVTVNVDGGRSAAYVPMAAIAEVGAA